MTTNTKIESLQSEALAAGDSEMAELCELALAGDEAAEQRCLDAIADAQAAADAE